MVNDFARFNGLLTTLDELYESLYSAMRLAPTAYFANIDDITKAVSYTHLTLPTILLV